MTLFDDFDDALEWQSDDDSLLGPDEPIGWFATTSQECHPTPRRPARA